MDVCSEVDSCSDIEIGGSEESHNNNNTINNFNNFNTMNNVNTMNTLNNNNYTDSNIHNYPNTTYSPSNINTATYPTPSNFLTNTYNSTYPNYTNTYPANNENLLSPPLEDLDISFDALEMPNTPDLASPDSLFMSGTSSAVTMEDFMTIPTPTALIWRAELERKGGKMMMDFDDIGFNDNPWL